MSREAHADLPGVRLWHLDTGGGGPAVVLMHAATGSCRVWEHQLPAFTRAGYRVVAPDRRGWGRSVIDPAGPQPGTAADDLHALLDHLGLDRVHLVGTAAGGIAALDFALSFPERLRTLVVANSIGGVQDEDYLALGRRLRPPQLRRSRPVTASPSRYSRRSGSRRSSSPGALISTHRLPSSRCSRPAFEVLASWSSTRLATRHTGKAPTCSTGSSSPS